MKQHTMQDSRRTRSSALFLAVILLGLAAGEAESQGFGLSGLPSAEWAEIEQGKILVRSVRDSKKLSLALKNPGADSLRSEVSSLRPNYLTEVIAILPGGSDSLPRLAAALGDVQGYVGIPYYSKRQKRFYDLFDMMSVQTRSATSTGEIILSIQHMEPFDDFSARYEWSLIGPAGARQLSFRGHNTSPLIYYGGIRAVKTGDMAWLLLAYEMDGRVVFYGIGAVRAFDLLGAVRDRLESSLIGRVEAFFSFMHTRLVGPAKL